MIVVTAPTGQIGRQVLPRILAGTEPVRVIVRDPSRLSADVRGRVEIVTGSHADRRVVERAFDGADSVFWLVPPDRRADSVEEAYVGFTRPAAAVMRQLAIPRVVGISAIGRGAPMANQAGFVTASLAMDDLIASTGVSYRALTMPSFMDNIARQAPLIRDQGIFTSPIRGDLKAPSVATRDIATVAAGLLLDHSWTGVEEVPLLGPEDLSFEDMARTMTEVLGRPVRFQQIGFAAYKERFQQLGMSDAMAQGQTDMARAKDAGLDNHVVRTPQSTTPTSFRQWCEEELKPLVLT